MKIRRYQEIWDSPNPGKNIANHFVDVTKMVGMPKITRSNFDEVGRRKSAMAKQVISASRRTDIPAFYADWFMNRIRAGFCEVHNPVTGKKYRVDLKPEDVEAIVFWTRNPRPLMKYLPELDSTGYKYYFQQTILGYPREIDPGSPPLDEAMAAFVELSQRIGKEKMVWRYDPILFSNITPFEWHIDRVSDILKNIGSHAGRLVISIIDSYRKSMPRMKTIEGFRPDDGIFEAETYEGLLKWIGREMKKAGLPVFTCAEDIDLSRYSIVRGRCIDDELISRISGRGIPYVKDPGQRKACGCTKSKDIGENNTCFFGCKYCYASGKTILTTVPLPSSLSISNLP